jgi:fructose-1,6-bisphosphatase I / sedoheptulose-1,7-bisphosphatase
MPLSKRWTLTRSLLEERRRFAQVSGDLSALIKAIARVVAIGERQGSFGDITLVQGGQTNGPGEVQEALDLHSNDGPMRTLGSRAFPSFPSTQAST